MTAVAYLMGCGWGIKRIAAYLGIVSGLVSIEQARLYRMADLMRRKPQNRQAAYVGWWRRQIA